MFIHAYRYPNDEDGSLCIDTCCVVIARTSTHMYSMAMATRLKKLQANLMVVKDERIKV